MGKSLLRGLCLMSSHREKSRKIALNSRTQVRVSFQSTSPSLKLSGSLRDSTKLSPRPQWPRRGLDDVVPRHQPMEASPKADGMTKSTQPSTHVAECPALITTTAQLATQTKIMQREAGSPRAEPYDDDENSI